MTPPVIEIDIFNVQVGIFETDKARVKYMRKRGGKDISDCDPASRGSAHRDMLECGTPLFSMVLPTDATVATWAHECVHIADFLMDWVGIPTGAENTEVRAYMVGHLMSGLERLRK